MPDIKQGFKFSIALAVGGLVGATPEFQSLVRTIFDYNMAAFMVRYVDSVTLFSGCML